MATVPSAQPPQWPWVAAGLAVVAALLGTLPVHAAAARRLARGQVDAAALASLCLLVGVGASIDAAARDGRVMLAVATAISAATVSILTPLLVTSFLPTRAWYTGCVVVLALGAAVAWWVLDGAGPARDVLVATLLASAPAAHLAAGPWALHSARHAVRDHGVTLPDPDVLPRAAGIDAVVLDKDGTLTTGGLTVVSVDAFERDHDRNLRWFAGALEHASGHRVGQAIASLSARGRLSAVHEDAHGIRGSVDRHPVRVGAPDWIGVSAPDTIWTTVGVEVDARPLGLITVADEVRPQAADAVQTLRTMGVGITAVSADRPPRLHEVAAEAGVEDVVSLSHPEESADVADRLRQEGHEVLTLGPGATGGLDADDLGLPDHDITRVSHALHAARRAVTSATAARRLATAVGLLGVTVVASGTLGTAAPLAAALGAAALTGVTLAIAGR